MEVKTGTIRVLGVWSPSSSSRWPRSMCESLTGERALPLSAESTRRSFAFERVGAIGSEVIEVFDDGISTLPRALNERCVLIARAPDYRVSPAAELDESRPWKRQRHSIVLSLGQLMGRAFLRCLHRILVWREHGEPIVTCGQTFADGDALGGLVVTGLVGGCVAGIVTLVLILLIVRAT